ncbi:MAG: type II toxin-antitoxin system HicB family antitoxin [Thermoanaerobaculales bacterium]
MNRVVHAIVRKGETAWVAECQEIAVVTQGSTLDQTIANLQEAVALHLDGEDPAEFGLASNPVVSVTLEIEPFSHAA